MIEDKRFPSDTFQAEFQEVLDYNANRGRLFAEAKNLSKASPAPTPELIHIHYGQDGTWYKNDWRGKDSKIPTPGQIRSTWLQLAGNPELTKPQRLVIR